VEVVREVVILVVLKVEIQVFPQLHQLVVVLAVVVFRADLLSREVAEVLVVAEVRVPYLLLVQQELEDQVMIQQQILYKVWMVELQPSQLILRVEVAEQQLLVKLHQVDHLLETVEMVRGQQLI
tara:strand:+ start:74 stop:445 length:372 start_codon:yes stop_codon:yes gene_type:complete